MKIKKHEIIISLLLLMLSMRLDVYGQSTEQSDHKRGADEEEQMAESKSRETPAPSIQVSGVYGRLMELVSLVLSTGETASATADSSVQRPAPGIRNPGGASKNPFTPLVVEHATKKTVNDAPVARKIMPAKPVIRLTATFISTGLQENKPTVIIEESGVSRLASIGDRIAGMTIAEIQRGKVILNRGNKKCVMTLGLLSDKTAASEP